ncbi:MAG: DUF6869 domain-containing protein [Acidobacteriota bacterium]
MSSSFDREGFLRDWFAERAPDSPIYGWATELLVHLTEDEPEVAWELVLGLLERATDDESLGWISAGPLEDLLCEHGLELVDHVEARAGSDPRFKKSLAGVGGSDRMDPDVYARVRAAAGSSRR